ncbi:PepSY domain-containing protein [Pseudothauera rhizosphaerae]|uniref:Peptidase n=1 Tax=Pseudothauera rhizosphaerae TaxID=2565932 RepID=A0A4S4AZC0_9RHOO|nr:PepSY domain-containing protein [Pseudothauera rhizosphaerae]THF65079.1 peptidase [Pseudothauera rhizosphaerae]
MSRPSLALALILAGAAGLALAADDHDRAREALAAGQILPLRSVLDVVERDHPGQVMEVELEREHGVWIYEVKLLRGDGTLQKLELDARSGELLRSRSRGER